MIPHPICFLRWVYRSIRCGWRVSGHTFSVDTEPTPPNIQVLKCDTCGHVEVCWDWESFEGPNEKLKDLMRNPSPWDRTPAKPFQD